VELDAPGHFDAQYRKNSDPWGYRTDFAEQRRHLMMLHCLPRPSYANAFEPACGNGEFTKLLAGRCGRLEAWDSSSVAVEFARSNLSNEPHVSLHASSVPHQWPGSMFDLIVLSDFSYYLTAQQVEAVKERVDHSITERGQILALHWTGTADDFVSDNSLLHDMFRADDRYQRCVQVDDPRMILEIWEKRG
jgi:trans-aconitate methyltransferase